MLPALGEMWLVPMRARVVLVSCLCKTMSTIAQFSSGERAGQRDIIYFWLVPSGGFDALGDSSWAPGWGEYVAREDGGNELGKHCKNVRRLTESGRGFQG